MTTGERLLTTFVGTSLGLMALALTARIVQDIIRNW